MNFKYYMLNLLWLTSMLFSMEAPQEMQNIIRDFSPFTLLKERVNQINHQKMQYDQEELDRSFAQLIESYKHIEKGYELQNNEVIEKLNYFFQNKQMYDANEEKLEQLTHMLIKFYDDLYFNLTAQINQNSEQNILPTSTELDDLKNNIFDLTKQIQDDENKILDLENIVTSLKIDILEKKCSHQIITQRFKRNTQDVKRLQEMIHELDMHINRSQTNEHGDKTAQLLGKDINIAKRALKNEQQTLQTMIRKIEQDLIKPMQSKACQTEEIIQDGVMPPKANVDKALEKQKKAFLAEMNNHVLSPIMRTIFKDQLPKDEILFAQSANNREEFFNDIDFFMDHIVNQEKEKSKFQNICHTYKMNNGLDFVLENIFDLCQILESKKSIKFFNLTLTKTLVYVGFMISTDKDLSLLYKVNSEIFPNIKENNKDVILHIILKAILINGKSIYNDQLKIHFGRLILDNHEILINNLIINEQEYCISTHTLIIDLMNILSSNNLFWNFSHVDQYIIANILCTSLHNRLKRHINTDQEYINLTSNIDKENKKILLLVLLDHLLLKKDIFSKTDLYILNDAIVHMKLTFPLIEIINILKKAFIQNTFNVKNVFAISETMKKVNFYFPMVSDIQNNASPEEKINFSKIKKALSKER